MPAQGSADSIIDSSHGWIAFRDLHLAEVRDPNVRCLGVVLLHMGLRSFNKQLLCQGLPALAIKPKKVDFWIRIRCVSARTHRDTERCSL